MATNKFTIRLKGDEADESLRLNDLIEQLDSIKKVLNELDKRVSGASSPTLYYRIVGLSMNSPATIEIEAVPKAKQRSPKSKYGAAVIRRLQQDIRQVNRGKRPENADLELLESYRSLSPSKGHVTQFEIQAGKQRVEVPASFEKRVDGILGPDQIEKGTLVGCLEVIDIHNQRNTFRIYPSVGRTSVKCHFPNALLTKALEGIGHFVRIHGELHFKSAEKFPHSMNVDRIERLPARSADFSLTSLRGIAKDAFGKIDSADYVDKVRSGDW